jgi:hypothetical protein
LNAVCPDGFEYYFVDEEFVVGRELFCMLSDCYVQKAVGRVTNAWGYNWATLFLGDIYGALQVEGVSKIEAIKCTHESRGTQI